MTNKEFCKTHTGYYGEVVDNIKQVAFISFTGEELKEYVEHHINEVKQEQPTEEQIIKEADSRSKKYPTESTKAAYSLGFRYGCCWVKDEINNK